METFTPTTGEVSRGTFEARSEVPSSSRAGVPYSGGDEFARLLSQERAARKHAERVADTHARSTRVLEVSKTELVRKMLSMKIKMEREEREKSAKDAERRAREEVERARIREEERLREDPHEGEILQEVGRAC